MQSALEAQSTSTSSTDTSHRPYRSHRFPACDLCRKRKARCVRALAADTCRLCQRLGASCRATQPRGVQTDGPSRGRPFGYRDRSTELLNPSAAAEGAFEAGHQDTIYDAPPGGQEPYKAVTNTDWQPESANAQHIVGPTTAHDVQLLQNTSKRSEKLSRTSANPNLFKVVSDDVEDPIVYLTVPRRRPAGQNGNGSIGFQHYEAIDKVLEPCGNYVVQTYFAKYHSAFPVLDEKATTEAVEMGTLPHVLGCGIYTCGIVFWNSNDDIRAMRPSKPDDRYIGCQFVEALNKAFVAPDYSTLLACILVLTARPTSSMIYNSIEIGRGVALAQTLGLNRNASKWKLDQRQRNLRMRTWWALLIHDWWASLSHGTPPHIHWKQFDVEIPEVEHLISAPAADASTNPDMMANRMTGARCFRALCSLTCILGNILHIIYDTNSGDDKTVMKTLRRICSRLDDWEDELPDELDPKSSDFQRHAPGALSLRIAFLAAQLCICRVFLLRTGVASKDRDDDAYQFHQVECRRAARAILDFARGLKEQDFQAFWLPYTSYHFASSAILMLRCAVEAPNIEVANECVSDAQQLLLCLQKARADSEWDIADVCLNQCGPIVRQFQKPSWLGQLRQKHSRARRASTSSPSNPAGVPQPASAADPSSEPLSMLQGRGPAQYEPLHTEMPLDPNLWQFDLDYFENQSNTVLFDGTGAFGEALFGIEEH